MQTREQSLLDYLRTPNPVVNGESCSGKGNTKSSGLTYEVPREIHVWEDFGYDALNNMYNGALHTLLEEKFNFRDYTGIPILPFCKYFDENSLDSLLIKWNHSVVSEALSKAQEVLEHTQEQIFMVRGGQVSSPYPERKWKPDWGCVKWPNLAPREKQKNLLPGDTKVSTKWSSSKIIPTEADSRHTATDDLRPLSQIYSYCLRNETRYGFLITDAELVAVRVRLDPAFNSSNSNPRQSLWQRAREIGVLDYKAIPWTANKDELFHTSDGMTVNLALWWLHMLAMGNTTIGNQEDYGALRDTEGGPLHRRVAALRSLWSDSGVSQPKKLPTRNGGQRSKSKANNKSSFEHERASRDGIRKRGRSQNARSAKSSFDRR